MARAALVGLLTVCLAGNALGFGLPSVEEYATRLMNKASTFVANQRDRLMPVDEHARGFRCPEDNGLFTNPDDCSSFYQCSAGQHWLLRCPAGLHFSEETSRCEYPCDARCNESLAEECGWNHETTTEEANVCTIAPERGPCKGKFPRYYYDEGVCRKFIYGGCGGNDNNFATKEECQSKCTNQEDLPCPEIRCVEGCYLDESAKPCPTCVCDPQPGECVNPNEKWTDCVIPCNDCEIRGKCQFLVCNEGCDCIEGYYKGSDGTCIPEEECPLNENTSFNVDKRQDSIISKDYPCFNNEIYTNPDDCGSYIKCTSGNSDVIKCPEGEHFSMSLLKCTKPCDAYCDPSLACECGWPNCGNSEVPRSSPVDYLPKWNCVKDGLYKNPENCSSFIQCSNGLAYVRPCPAGLHFSPETKICEYKCDAHCEERLVDECHWNYSVICQFQARVGPCKSWSRRYFFDTMSSRCKQFVYGGCGGNSNNFRTLAECERNCKNDQGSVDYTESIVDFECVTDGLYRNPKNCSSFIQCSNGLAYEQPCPEGLHFSLETKRCEEKCDALCDGSLAEECDWNESVICRFAPEKGPCRASLKRYFFDVKSGKCKKFEYGGCQGNGNNFETKEDCESSCKSIEYSKLEESPEEQIPVATEDFHQALGYCQENGVYADPEDCSRYIQCSDGLECVMPCPYGLHFSEGLGRCVAPCDAHCNKTIACRCGWPECSEMEVNCEADAVRGPCRANIPKYYYDRDSGRCRKFLYGGCGGNTNNFVSEEECREKCQKKLLGGYRCPAPNGKFANFYDCISYYYCKKDVPILKRCPRGMAFDYKMSKCVIEFEAACLYKCRDRDAVYPYHPDCHKYIDCVNGISKVERCSLGKAFDWRTNDCVDESTVDCSIN